MRMRPLAVAGLVVGVVVILLVLVDAFWGYYRSEYLLSLLFFGIVGYLSGVGILLLVSMRKMDPIQIISGTSLILALLVSWYAGPGPALRRSLPVDYSGPEDWAPGMVFFGVGLWTFLIGGKHWEEHLF